MNFRQQSHIQSLGFRRKSKTFSCALRKYCLLMLVTVSMVSSEAQKIADPIRLNQVGYYPNEQKLAMVVGPVGYGPFYLVNADCGDTVYQGSFGKESKSANSSTITHTADFSAWRTPGRYILQVHNLKPSFPFYIGEGAYNQLGKAVLKGFYYQRCTIPLEAAFAGKWARGPGHADNIVLVHPSAVNDFRPAGTTISSPGGWYDAGDYNKYVVNCGITMGTLLSAYEDFPVYFDSLRTNIPESGDKVPDILNEVIFNLRWMLTMQDPSDGGVYHKCTNADFDGMEMPGVTKEPRYVVQKSTAATLDFAAVMAQAARVLKKLKSFYPHLADTCLKASANAWYWALKHPAIEYDQSRMNKEYKPSVSTGAYGDKHLEDEWMWAATEMFVTSRNKMYFEAIDQNADDSATLPSWSNVRMLGYYTLLRYKENLPKYAKEMADQMQERLVTMANEYLARVSANAFGSVMGQSKRDFVWGSNSVAANQSILLINAYLATGDQKYVLAALTNLDYLLGRNATGYCFVTGFGTKSPMHPHHRPSVSDGIDEPVPGLLVGGPNPGRQDKCKYIYTEPETAYLDTDCAYASNEIAINWNAPMVYLVNAIEAIHSQLKFSGK
jgi:endoglucanase